MKHYAYKGSFRTGLYRISSFFLCLQIAHWFHSPLPFILMLRKMEVLFMFVIWAGTLAILLNKFWHLTCRIETFKDDYNEVVKRYGVYYMCIDDLPL